MSPSQTMPAQGSILVVRGGAIGDFILTLPVLAALRKHFPQTRLEVLGYPHIASLARPGGLVDDVRYIEARAMAGFFAANGSLAPELVEYFSGFDLIVSYLFDPDEVFQTNVKRCGKARFIAGPHRPNEALRVHAAECLLQPLERLAIFDADPVPRLPAGRASSLPVSKEHHRNSREVFSLSQRPGPVGHPSASFAASVDVASANASGRDARPTVALHPGSGDERKNWPEHKWATLLERLAGKPDWKFLIVGGEAEEDRLSRLGSLLPEDRSELALRLPLPQLAERLALCSSFIGHDSGISHLAAAVGLPGIVLWGDSVEDVWRPRGEGIRIVRHSQGLTAMTVDQVWTAVDAVCASLRPHPERAD